MKDETKLAPTALIGNPGIDTARWMLAGFHCSDGGYVCFNFVQAQ